LPVDEIFREGVNIVQKEFPYYPILPDSHLDDLKNWGFNVVRLGVLWRGVEPTRGNYNITYLQESLAFAEKLAARGIFVIIDSHQDVFAPTVCGDGFPDWYFCDHLEGITIFRACQPASTIFPFAEPVHEQFPIIDGTIYHPASNSTKNIRLSIWLL
jgi:hypothetical protein